LSQGQWVLVMLSLVASVLTLVSMLKIWLGSFWNEQPAGVPLRLTPATRRMTAAVALLVVASLGVGSGSNTISSTAEHAGNESLDRAAYAETVRAVKMEIKGGQP